MSHERLSEHDLRYGLTNPWIARFVREKGVTGLIHTLYQAEKGGSGDEMVTLGLFVVSSLGGIILIASVASELKTTPTVQGGPPTLTPLRSDKVTATATAPKFETPVQFEEATTNQQPSPTNTPILSEIKGPTKVPIRVGTETQIYCYVSWLNQLVKELPVGTFYEGETTIVYDIKNNPTGDPLGWASIKCEDQNGDGENECSIDCSQASW